MTLEEIKKRWPVNVFYPPWIDGYDVEDIRKAYQDIQWLIERVRVLEEGIMKHKNTPGYGEWRLYEKDIELYKLIRK